MKKYVKLQEGKLVYPPKFYNNIINYNRNEKALIKDGWKEYIIEPSEFEVPEGKEFYTYYEETDNAIIAKFGLKDVVIPEKSGYETVEELKNKLNESDYKVIKCYEYTLVGKEPPYDVEELHAERQAIRDTINKLNQTD